MLKNIQDSQDADLKRFAEPQQNHGQYKELYRSDIEKINPYEQYLKKYRDKLLELSTSLLTYYDELINSINIGYQKENRNRR
jgi:hypothetical protein